MYSEKFLETIKLLKSLFFVDTLYSKRTQRKVRLSTGAQDIWAFGHSVTKVPGYLGTRGTLFRKLNFLFIVNKQ